MTETVETPETLASATQLADGDSSGIFSPEELAKSRHDKVRRIATFLRDPQIMDRIRSYSERYWDQKWDENW